MEGTRLRGGAVYAAKGLDADGAAHTSRCRGGLLFNPPRQPHGECGVWGSAPRFVFGKWRSTSGAPGHTMWLEDHPYKQRGHQGHLHAQVMSKAIEFTT